MWSPLVRQANDFLPFSITEPHLLVILSKWGADWIFVNSLYNTYDFSITVADGHTEDGLSLVPGQLVNLITEAVILELWSYKHTGYYIFIDRSPHLKHTHTHTSQLYIPSPYARLSRKAYDKASAAFRSDSWACKFESLLVEAVFTISRETLVPLTGTYLCCWSSRSQEDTSSCFFSFPSSPGRWYNDVVLTSSI